MNKLIQAEAMLKAERMYASITTDEQLAIVDRYAERAEPRPWFYGALCYRLLDEPRAKCVMRLKEKSSPSIQHLVHK